MKKIFAICAVMAFLAQSAFAESDFDILMRGAQQGRAGAQFCVGYMYATGDGVRENHQEAAKWFRKAAEQGHKHLNIYWDVRI